MAEQVIMLGQWHFCAAVVGGIHQHGQVVHGQQLQRLIGGDIGKVQPYLAVIEIQIPQGGNAEDLLDISEDGRIAQIQIRQIRQMGQGL